MRDFVAEPRAGDVGSGTGFLLTSPARVASPPGSIGSDNLAPSFDQKRKSEPRSADVPWDGLWGVRTPDRLLPGRPRRLMLSFFYP